MSSLSPSSGQALHVMVAPLLYQETEGHRSSRRQSSALHPVSLLSLALTALFSGYHTAQEPSDQI